MTKSKKRCPLERVMGLGFHLKFFSVKTLVTQSLYNPSFCKCLHRSFCDSPRGPDLTCAHDSAHQERASYNTALWSFYTHFTESVSTTPTLPCAICACPENVKVFAKYTFLLNINSLGAKVTLDHLSCGTVSPFANS